MNEKLKAIQNEVAAAVGRKALGKRKLVNKLTNLSLLVWEYDFRSDTTDLMLGRRVRANVRLVKDQYKTGFVDPFTWLIIQVLVQVLLPIIINKILEWWKKRRDKEELIEVCLAAAKELGL